MGTFILPCSYWNIDQERQLSIVVMVLFIFLDLNRIKIESLKNFIFWKNFSLKKKDFSLEFLRNILFIFLDLNKIKIESLKK